MNKTPSSPSNSREARARDRALLKTLVSSAGQQLATIAATLITLPVVTHALTTEEYGVVATCVSAVALLQFADFGAGLALTHRLARTVAGGRVSGDDTRSLVGTALVVVGSTALLLLTLGMAAAFTLPWGRIFGAPHLPERDLGLCAAAAVFSIALGVVATLGNRILYGLQRGHAANGWLMASTANTCGASVAAAALQAPLPFFVLAALGTPSLTAAAGTLWVIRSTHNVDLRPAFRGLDLSHIRDFTSTSSWFLLLGAAGAIGYQTDVIIVASVAGADDAATYSVAARIFGLVLQCLYPALLQIWPAFSEALARDDAAWVRSRFKLATLSAGLLSAAACLVIVLAGNTVISRWLTPQLTMPSGLSIALAMWTSYSLFSAPTFLLMNATGQIRTHALLATAVAAANLPLSVTLTEILGVSGPAYGSLIANVLLQGIPGVYIGRRLLRTLPTTTVVRATVPCGPTKDSKDAE
jgi:O-antigen/teichoic acid export membrane protein